LIKRYRFRQRFHNSRVLEKELVEEKAMSDYKERLCSLSQSEHSIKGHIRVLDKCLPRLELTVLTNIVVDFTFDNKA